jgi:hypothetical protein
MISLSNSNPLLPARALSHSHHRQTRVKLLLNSPQHPESLWESSWVDDKIPPGKRTINLLLGLAMLSALRQQ